MKIPKHRDNCIPECITRILEMIIYLLIWLFLMNVNDNKQTDARKWMKFEVIIKNMSLLSRDKFSILKSMWKTMECKRGCFSGALGGVRETHWECVSHAPKCLKIFFSFSYSPGELIAKYIKILFEKRYVYRLTARTSLGLHRLLVLRGLSGLFDLSTPTTTTVNLIELIRSAIDGLYVTIARSRTQNKINETGR